MGIPKAVKLPVLLALVLAAVFAAGCVSSTEEFIEMGDDRIPSLYAAIGEKKVTGSSSSANTSIGSTTGEQKSVTYAQGAVTNDEVQAYINALADDGYMQTVETHTEGETEVLQLAKESSSKEGFIITVDIEFNPLGSTKLTYSAFAGTLEPRLLEAE